MHNFFTEFNIKQEKNPPKKLIFFVALTCNKKNTAYCFKLRRYI